MKKGGFLCPYGHGRTGEQKPSAVTTSQPANASRPDCEAKTRVDIKSVLTYLRRPVSELYRYPAANSSYKACGYAGSIYRSSRRTYRPHWHGMAGPLSDRPDGTRLSSRGGETRGTRRSQPRARKEWYIMTYARGSRVLCRRDRCGRNAPRCAQMRHTCPLGRDTYRLFLQAR